MTIDLYMAPASGPCRAAIMTAKCLGLDVNLKMVNLQHNEHMNPEFLRMNPQHCVPTLDDNGFFLWESRAIQTYLVDQYAPNSPLYPKDPKARAVVDKMLYFDIGTLYKGMFELLYPQLFYGQSEPDPQKSEAFTKALQSLEGFLSETPYVAGDHMTVADFTIVATLTFAYMSDYSYDAFPKITAWIQKLRSEIPSFKEINDDKIAWFKELLRSKNKK